MEQPKKRRGRKPGYVRPREEIEKMLETKRKNKQMKEDPKGYMDEHQP